MYSYYYAYKLPVANELALVLFYIYDKINQFREITKRRILLSLKT
jgi:hypothetical protein